MVNYSVGSKDNVKKLLLGSMSTRLSSYSVLLLFTFVIIIITTIIIAAFAAITSISPIIQPAAAATTANNNNTMRIDLVVDTTTLKFQDVNNNTQPDAGEFAIVLGKLYTPGTTENEIGTYRCFFPWGGWANSTEGVPVTLGMQVFDIKGNGTIVVVGDEPTTDSVDMPVAGAIAGGTNQFNGVAGMATLTAKPLEGTDFPLEVMFEFIQPPQTNTTTTTAGG
jgi:hypothetical protein